MKITDLINLGTETEMKEVKIGTAFGGTRRERLIELLRKYKDVFAWSYQDMPGLDADIVVHRLPLRPECIPVKQKLRRMKPELLLKVRDDIKKQFDAGFLAVAHLSLIHI